MLPVGRTGRAARLHAGGVRVRNSRSSSALAAFHCVISPTVRKQPRQTSCASRQQLRTQGEGIYPEAMLRFSIIKTYSDPENIL
jgi:hypothetical protein